MLERLFRLLARYLGWLPSRTWVRGGYPPPRHGKTGVAAIKRAARKTRNRRRVRHA